MTRYKLSVMPFLKTLDFSFFIRVALFGGILALFSIRLGKTSEERVVCKQEGPESPTRFSKTFGQEKKLDSILNEMNKEPSKYKDHEK